jgi:uncharacterized protein YjbI with pentapeptide repeats
MIEIRHKQSGEVLYRVPTATLAGARLQGRKLQGAGLRGADLRGAFLARADLSNADLEGAILAQARGASRSHWVLTQWGGGILLAGTQVLARTLLNTPHGRVHFILQMLPFVVVMGFLLRARRIAGNRPRPGSTVRLHGASLRMADLTRVDLRGTNLELADLEAACLVGADLQGAILHYANLHKANLKGAGLSGAWMGGALLRFADLQGAALRSAYLKGADLRAANLCQADLRYADLREANLRGADLRALLDGVKLQGAQYDETTRWPAGFVPPRIGNVRAAEVVPAQAPGGRGDELASATLAPRASAEDTAQ